MKRLGILRHAKSGWDDPALADFDRPLNERGREAAGRVGEEFRKLQLDYDLALVSPARRAVETFALVSGGWGIDLDLRSEPRLYGASLAELSAIIAEAPPQVERLLLVGHNPGLHDLAKRMSSDDGSPARASLAAKLPTGSLVEIVLGSGSWAEAAASPGELLRFLRPRDLEFGR